MYVEKFSLSISTPVYNALVVEAKQLGREPHEHIQRVLTQHVIDQQTLAADDAERLQLNWRVVDRCVETARRICRDGGFSEHITLEAIQQCTRDPNWLEDYAKCIEDDVYKHGNPLKGPINRAIGAQIRAAIGGVVKKDSNGKPVMKRVLGEIIQGYTLFDAFDPEVVSGPGDAARQEVGYVQTSGDSCLQGESIRTMTVSDRRDSVNFGRRARERQARFREESSLPVFQDGRRHGHLLASGYEDENLYPTLRGDNGARRFFEARSIRWWQDTRNGDDSNGQRPTRNMASSQVACVNFLLPLTEVPDALPAVLRAVDDDVTGIVPFEDQHTRSPVEFEWIGLGHALEGPKVKTRGANSTSVDAFMIARTRAGRRAYLMEWKYVEEYSPKDLGEGSKGETRRRRYAHLHAESPSFSDKAPLDAWLFEPFYQILRLRLLADRMVRDRELGVSEAKVLVVVPEGNRAYRERITSPWLATAFPNRTVSDILRETLVDPDNTYATVSQSTLAGAVREHCAEAAASWSAYHRDRYGW